MRRWFWLLAVLGTFGVYGFPREADAAPLKKLRLAFSALAYANPPFWIAHELKLFEKHGYDTEEYRRSEYWSVGIME
jgi:ABC-type nitrate/sulfonate/bicarbonate transport system substrate-binding protein